MTHTVCYRVHIVPGTENAIEMSYFLTPGLTHLFTTQMAKSCLNLDPAEPPKTKEGTSS